MPDDQQSISVQSEAFDAWVKLQSAMKNAALNKVNPHFKSKYADLPAVIDAAKLMNSQGFFFMQSLEFVENHYGCLTKIFHSSGCLMNTAFAPITLGQKPQQMGSEITYARRYSLSTACGIAADKDDDGNGAQAQAQAQPRNHCSPTKQAMTAKRQQLIRDMEACLDEGDLQGYEAIRKGDDLKTLVDDIKRNRDEADENLKF